VSSLICLLATPTNRTASDAGAEQAGLEHSGLRFLASSDGVEQQVRPGADDQTDRSGHVHFEVVGKWGIDKWFRIPEGLYRELLAIRTDSPFVFAAYPQQLRSFYEQSDRPGQAGVVAMEFNPANLGDWFHGQIVDWSATQPRDRPRPTYSARPASSTRGLVRT
jgi:hypothetical protein